MHVATKVHHPVFARIYARVGKAAEAKGGAAHRDELLAGLTGQVIEVGAGNGLNFRHYPTSVTEVVAVEPESYLRERAEEAAKDASVPITVVDGAADHLPADDASFDAGVASLVLCSVDDQAAALAELRRVIRPGGELRFYEHVISDRPRLARVQRALDRTIWPIVGGGCHASRDTLAGIEAAGFTIEESRNFEFRPAPAIPTAPHILGVARRP
jgi:ubiquinone/menaquinone biosynthesis C-methylase UbiE